MLVVETGLGLEALKDLVSCIMYYVYRNKYDLVNCNNNSDTNTSIRTH